MENIERWSGLAHKIKPLALAAFMTAVVATLSACNGTTHPEKQQEHKTEKAQEGKTTTLEDKTTTLEDKTTTLEEKTNGTSVEADSDSQSRKIISTENYIDEYDQTIKKEIYDDGSRSIEWKSDSGEYSGYVEYYPNSNNKKFERANFGIGNGFQEGTYAIYNKDGKILYYKEGSLQEIDGSEQNNTYDKEGRITYDAWSNTTYTYDEVNRQVIALSALRTGDNKNLYREKTVYGMTSDGELDEDRIISCVFIGETGHKINLMNNEGIEKLIKEMKLEKTPYINNYEQLD